MWLVRLKFNLNNSAELLTCGDGSAVYLVSKGKCSYVAHRELPLACIWIANILASALTRLLNSCWRVLRFSFGSGEWREASASRLQGFDRWSKLYQNLLFEKLFRGYSYIVTKSGPGNMVRTSSMGCKENRHATKEATELMRECPDGRWFNFVMAFDSVVILEKKGIPEHLLQLNVLDRPSFLRKVLAELEDMGEAINIRFKTKLHSPNNWYTENVLFLSTWFPGGGLLQVAVKISHHSIGANAPAPTVDKPLVFVLDEPKEENEGKKRGKKNKNTFQPSIKNFGSRVNINKFKSSSKMILAWRCRFGSFEKPSEPQNRQVSSISRCYVPKVRFFSILWLNSPCILQNHDEISNLSRMLA